METKIKKLAIVLFRHYNRKCYSERRKLMNIALEPIVSLIAGILILVMPTLLNYIVAIYLILIGIVGLLH
jgi:hypothetical protein